MKKHLLVKELKALLSDLNDVSSEDVKAINDHLHDDYSITTFYNRVVILRKHIACYLR